MARTLAQIEAQMAKLAAEAEAVRAKEVAGVIAQIREAIEHYQLTAADLGFTGRLPAKRTTGAKPAARNAPRRSAATRTRQSPAAKKKRAGVIKFRDDAGNAWTGHGKRPNWFKEALAAGRTPEDLAVK